MGGRYRFGLVAPLMQQRYLLANPFAGLKVRGAGTGDVLPMMRAFPEGEWSTIQAVADGLERSYGWEPVAAQRLRFMLDFAYATGLRASELVSARLGMIEQDARGERWLCIAGKSSKGRVALPLLARAALDRHLAQTGLPTTPSQWNLAPPLIASLEQNSVGGIAAARLWAVMKRFFAQVVNVVEDEHAANKLRQVSLPWMRNVHAVHVLERGVRLTTMRDNLRQESVSTTSLYLHTDEEKRVRQLGTSLAPRVR